MQNTYVFCDVDGVLNSMPYFERIKGLKGFHEINDKNVEVLSLIILEPLITKVTRFLFQRDCSHMLMYI